MAIVLPDAILGAPSLLYVRHWILRHCRVVASIDMHPDTFQPRNGTQTSVLFLQKKTPDEMSQEAASKHLRNYKIFMAEVMAIGHDKRGNPVYVRSRDGEEVLFDSPKPAGVIETSATGATTGRVLPRQKRLDDDTALVADEFMEWKRKEVLGW